MEKYRITFSNGPESNVSCNKDVMAEDSDDAFRKAYAMPESKSGRYSEVIVQKIPDGKTTIGLENRTRDTAIRRDFTGYVFVQAISEKAAADWYNKNLLGKRFWFDTNKPEADGKCIYGNVMRTYYADGVALFDAANDLE